MKRDGVYLITGGLGGLGLQTAKWFAQQGAGTLVLCGRSEPKGEAVQLIEEIKSKGTNVIVSQGDIRKRGPTSTLHRDLRGGR